MAISIGRSVKITLLTTGLAVLVASTTPAFAGGPKQHRGAPHNRSYNHAPRHYAPRGRYYNNRGRYYNDYGPAYFFGGLMLGTLLTQQAEVTTTRIVNAPVERVVVRQPVVIRESRLVEESAAPPPSRRLLRDLGGNCFEIERRDDGSELRSELPATECNW